MEEYLNNRLRDLNIQKNMLESQGKQGEKNYEYINVRIDELELTLQVAEMMGE